MSLREAASALGVHYMTAYRYVRTGRLPATSVDGEWRIRRDDVQQLLRPEEGRAPVARPSPGAGSCSASSPATRPVRGR